MRFYFNIYKRNLSEDSLRAYREERDKIIYLYGSWKKVPYREKERLIALKYKKERDKDERNTERN